jgi:phage/plasmid-like protein (TIGR03299 family)
MFSVGETPWHGLGHVLECPPSIDEALQLTGLDWEVDLRPLYLEDGRKVTHNAVCRTDRNEVLGVVGPNYKPLQNREAFGVFQPFVEQKILALETGGSLRAGRRVWLLGRFLGLDPQEVVAGDEVRPYLLLSTGHDGLVCVRYGLTPIRVVCNNTLQAAHANGKESGLLRVLHTENVVESLGDVSQIVLEQHKSFDIMMESFRLLAKRQIVSSAQLKRYIKEVFRKAEDEDVEEAEDTLGTALNAITGTIVKPESTAREDEILALFEHGRGSHIEATRGTWWAAYNAINEWVLYSRGRSQESRFEQALWGAGRSIDAKALQIALKMAA